MPTGGSVRRRAARSLALGVVLFVPGLVVAALHPGSTFVAEIAAAFGIIGLPLVIQGSYRLIFGEGGQSSSVFASIGRIVFGVVVVLLTVVLAFAMLALVRRV